MSVYITINQAHLHFNPNYDVTPPHIQLYTQIKSDKTSILTHLLPPTKNPKWACSFIGSIK